MITTIPVAQPSRIAESHLLALRPQFDQSRFASDTTLQALAEMHALRARLAYPDVPASAHPVLADSRSIFAWDKKAVAARIAGIATDLKKARSTQGGPHILSAAAYLRGWDEIDEFQNAVASCSEQVAQSIATSPAKNKLFARSFSALSGAAILMGGVLDAFAHGGAPSDFALAAGAFGLIFEPHGVAWHHLQRDGWHALSQKRLRQFQRADERDSARWVYDAANYRLHRGLVNQILHPRTSLANLSAGLVRQEDFDMDGPFLRHVLRPLVTSLNARAKSPSVRAQALRDAPAWVGLDRLLTWDRRTREPIMVLFARAQSGPPKYKKPAQAPQTAPALSLQFT